MIRPFPTGCALCGEKRFSGWVLVHGTYRVPICTRHLSNATFGCIPIFKVGGEVFSVGAPRVYLRRAGVSWRVEQEKQVTRRRRRKRPTPRRTRRSTKPAPPGA